MDIVKFKITSKTIKIEVHNSNNYVFDFNKAVEMKATNRDILLKLYNAMEMLFKKENNSKCKHYILLNQMNILDRINEVSEKE